MQNNFIKKLILGLIVLNFAMVSQAQTLAFTANFNNNWDLFVAELDSKNPTRLTETKYDEQEISFSKDGKSILFSNTQNEINVIDLGTKKIKTIINSSIEDGKKVHPAFSPDNRYIVYTHFKPKTADNTDLEIIDTKTSVVKLLSKQRSSQFFPNWSHDGTRIVYANLICTSACGKSIQEIWVANIFKDTAEQLLLTNSLNHSPVWSHDDSKIAFVSDLEGSNNIWIYDLTKSELTKVTDTPYLDTMPSWSPDDTKIAFISNRAGFSTIWIKDLKNDKLETYNPFGSKKVEINDVAWH